MKRVSRSLSLALTMAIIFTMVSSLGIIPASADSVNLAYVGGVSKTSFTNLAANCHCINDGVTTSSYDLSPTVANWVAIDLGASYNISYTNTKVLSNGTYYYQIDVSNDKINWTNVVNHSATSSGLVMTDNFSAQARYVRYTNTAGHAGPKITEFEIYGDSTTPVANTNPTLLSQGHYPKCTNDGITSNGLADNNFLTAGATKTIVSGTPTSFSMDLGSVSNISKFVIAQSWVNNAETNAYSIQVSSDNTNWTTVVNHTTQITMNQAYTTGDYFYYEDFCNTQARYIIFSINSTNQTSQKFNELAVYGPVAATSVALNKHISSIMPGATDQLSATLLPLDTTNNGVTWSSSNTSIATVDSNGKITAVSPGSATITATANDTTNGTLTDTCAVTVMGVILTTSVSLNKYTDSINLGATDSLIATAAPSGASQIVKWNSDNPGVATVDYNTGLITAVSKGSANITAISNDGTNISSLPCVVTVVKLPTVVTLNKSSTTIDAGNNETLIATVSPSDASDTSVSWSSSNISVATVDSTGNVTAVALGVATITSTTNANGLTATCAVTVSDPAIDYVNSLISALPTTITIANKAQVIAANTAYIALTSTEQAFISGDNYAKLTNAMAIIFPWNLLPVVTSDPGFEDVDQSSWHITGGNKNATITTGNAHGGSYDLQIGASSGGYQYITSLKPNTDYVFKVWVKVQNPATDVVTLIVQKYNGASSDTRATSTNSDTNYKQLSLSFTTGSDPSGTVFTIWNYGTGTDKVYADDVQLFQVPPVAFDSNYNISSNNIVTNIQAGTTVSQVKQGLTYNSNTTVTFYSNSSKSSTIADGGTVGTGTIIEATNGSDVVDFTIVIYGDVNGDGAINLNDLVSIRNYVLGTQSLSGVYQQAGNLYGESDISLNDLVGMMAVISESGSINQNL